MTRCLHCGEPCKQEICSACTAAVVEPDDAEAVDAYMRRVHGKCKEG